MYHIAVKTILLPHNLTSLDTNSYQDIRSNSPQHESDTTFEYFDPHTSNKTIAQHEANLRSPTYQNLYPSTPLNDNLGDRFNSTDFDFEKLKNLIYHSTSFPRFL